MQVNFEMLVSILNILNIFQVIKEVENIINLEIKLTKFWNNFIMLKPENEDEYPEPKKNLKK